MELTPSSLRGLRREESVVSRPSRLPAPTTEGSSSGRREGPEGGPSPGLGYGSRRRRPLMISSAVGKPNGPVLGGVFGITLGSSLGKVVGVEPPPAGSRMTP